MHALPPIQPQCSVVCSAVHGGRLLLLHIFSRDFTLAMLAAAVAVRMPRCEHARLCPDPALPFAPSVLAPTPTATATVAVAGRPVCSIPAASVRPFLASPCPIFITCFHCPPIHSPYMHTNIHTFIDADVHLHTARHPQQPVVQLHACAHACRRRSIGTHIAATATTPPQLAALRCTVLLRCCAVLCYCTYSCL